MDGCMSKIRRAGRIECCLFGLTMKVHVHDFFRGYTAGILTIWPVLILQSEVFY